MRCFFFIFALVSSLWLSISVSSLTISCHVGALVSVSVGAGVGVTGIVLVTPGVPPSPSASAVVFATGVAVLTGVGVGVLVVTIGVSVAFTPSLFVVCTATAPGALAWPLVTCTGSVDTISCSFITCAGIVALPPLRAASSISLVVLISQCHCR